MNTEANNTEATAKFANHFGYSDVNPFEIIKRISSKTIEIRAMTAERHPDYKPHFIPGGFSAHCTNQGEQEWVITSNPEANVFRIRLGKKGWKDAGGNLYGLSDKPSKFYDFNF